MTLNVPGAKSVNKLVESSAEHRSFHNRHGSCLGVVKDKGSGEEPGPSKYAYGEIWYQRRLT